MAQIIQQLRFLNESLKGVRGLRGDFAFAGMERVVVNLAGLAAALDGVKLEPGAETPVIVPLPDAPRNADIKSLKAFIDIRKDASAQSSSVKQTSTIKEGQDNPKNYEVDISLPDLPMNISVKLDGGEVFWSFAGRDVEGERELPDFVGQVNDYLDRLPADVGEVALKFLVKSDGPGRVKITVKDVKHTEIQTQSWPNPLDGTTRLDRNFQLDFGGVEKIAVDAYDGKTKRPLSLSTIRVDAGGEFGPERLLGGFEAHRGNEFATISNDYSLAQGFNIGKELTAKPVRCAGVTGAFQADAEAELYVEIQSDAGDFPASGAPLAKSNLTLSPGQESGRWAFARFDAPVDLNPETAYWVVVKGIRGRARLGLQSQPGSYLRRVSVNRGGQLWKDMNRPSAGAAPPAALLRLVYLPELDNQSAAIEIGVEGAIERLDPKPEAQTISLKLPEGRGAGEAVIIIKSHARGSLSVANIIQEYTT